MSSSTEFNKTLEICNQLGLHARAAAKFVQTSARYGCDIWVTHDNQTVNGKSIMGIMMLAASYGTKLDVKASGEQAQDALSAIEALLADKFGEE
jgi:phosphocarrier protein HPr